MIQPYFRLNTQDIPYVSPSQSYSTVVRVTTDTKISKNIKNQRLRSSETLSAANQRRRCRPSSLLRLPLTLPLTLPLCYSEHVRLGVPAAHRTPYTRGTAEHGSIRENQPMLRTNSIIILVGKLRQAHSVNHGYYTISRDGILQYSSIR